MIDKIKKIIGRIIFGFVGLFVVLFVISQIFDYREMSHRATDPIYKAQAEETDRIEEEARADAKKERLNDERIASEWKAYNAKRDIEDILNRPKKAAEEAYLRQVEIDSEKLIATRKYMKDVQEAADRKER